jgi:DNA-binding XRE family transcriptional regulator
LSKQVAVDSSGNPVEVLTIRASAKYLNITEPALKLYLFKRKLLPFYKVMGRAGTKIIRIRKKDLDTFVLDYHLYDGIRARIREARKEVVVVRQGLTQKELAGELGCSETYIKQVETGKSRVGLKMLERIAKITDRDFEWFLD